MQINRWFYLPVFIIFVLCGLIRLAYFDVTEQIRTEDPNCGKRTYYEGMPITNSAFFLPIFYLIATLFDASSIAYTAIMVVGYLFLAIAFICPVKTPKPGVKKILLLILILTVLLAVLVGLHFALDKPFSPWSKTAHGFKVL